MIYIEPLGGLQVSSTGQRISFTNSSAVQQTYELSNRHRSGGGQNNKSLWTVSAKKELELFEDSYVLGYGDTAYLWNIDDNLVGKGTQRGGSREVKICKFQLGQPSTNWHGYPFDVCEVTSPEQRIPKSVLEMWYNKDKISRTDIRKIQEGSSRCKY